MANKWKVVELPGPEHNLIIKEGDLRIASLTLPGDYTRAQLLAAAPFIYERLLSIIEWQDDENLDGNEDRRSLLIRNAARAGIQAVQKGKVKYME